MSNRLVLTVLLDRSVFFAHTLSDYPRIFRKKGALDGVFLFRKCYDRTHEEADRQTIGAFLFTN
ncbi:hypothetical protein BH739_05245 [Enterococcus casseliflavus]|nr:hypothetical protein BH739_05245 [Enterococcus casseliflavus]